MNKVMNKVGYKIGKEIKMLTMRSRWQKMKIID